MTSSRIKYLQERLNARIHKGFSGFNAAIIESESLWEEALTLARDEDSRIAFRASWALGTALEKRPDVTTTLFLQITKDYITLSNQSVLRQYGKILACNFKRNEHMLPQNVTVKLAEKGIDILIDSDTDAAVKIWAMEILYLLRHIEIVHENFEYILRDLLARNPLPSIENKSVKMLHRLNGARNTKK